MIFNKSDFYNYDENTTLPEYIIFDHKILDDLYKIESNINGNEVTNTTRNKIIFVLGESLIIVLNHKISMAIPIKNKNNLAVL